MHKVFITYHHENDQYYKEALLQINEKNRIFIDNSVDTGDISDDLDDQTIRSVIRDDYLRDSTVSILLVGTETKGRKHVDWELYSSMIDGTVNKNLASLSSTYPQPEANFVPRVMAQGSKLASIPKFSIGSLSTLVLNTSDDIPPCPTGSSTIC